jgi:hypothetical protein
MLRIASIAFVSASAFVIACGSDSKPPLEAFDTFQKCYDEHHTDEMLSAPCAIEICCIDHPIGPGATTPNIVCGDTKASCQTYVGSNVTDPADTMLGSDIDTACTNYPIDAQKPGAGSGSGGMCSG